MRPGTRSFAVAVGIVVAVGTHILLGWMFSVAGAVLGGWLWPGRRGLLPGLLVLSASWLGLLLWSFGAAPSETREMARVVGSLLGGLPPGVTPVLTVLIAALLGAAGGALGSSIEQLITNGNQLDG